MTSSYPGIALFLQENPLCSGGLRGGWAEEEEEVTPGWGKGCCPLLPSAVTPVIANEF